MFLPMNYINLMVNSLYRKYWEPIHIFFTKIGQGTLKLDLYDKNNLQIN